LDGTIIGTRRHRTYLNTSRAHPLRHPRCHHPWAEITAVQRLLARRLIVTQVASCGSSADAVAVLLLVRLQFWRDTSPKTLVSYFSQNASCGSQVKPSPSTCATGITQHRHLWTHRPRCGSSGPRCGSHRAPPCTPPVWTAAHPRPQGNMPFITVDFPESDFLQWPRARLHPPTTLDTYVLHTIVLCVHNKIVIDCGCAHCSTGSNV
jgi:hypothetical protein